MLNFSFIHSFLASGAFEEWICTTAFSAIGGKSTALKGANWVLEIWIYTKRLLSPSLHEHLSFFSSRQAYIQFHIKQSTPWWTLSIGRQWAASRNLWMFFANWWEKNRSSDNQIHRNFISFSSSNCLVIVSKISKCILTLIVSCRLWEKRTIYMMILFIEIPHLSLSYNCFVVRIFFSLPKP